MGAYLVVACLAGFAGLTRGNGWFLAFAVVPVAGALTFLATWFGACAVLGETGRRLVGARGEIAGPLARTGLGAILLAQSLGALLALGLGALERAYGLRLGDWALAGVALCAFFVALSAATLEPLTLGRAEGRDARPENLGAAAALALVRPMRSLIVLAGLSALAFDRLSRPFNSPEPALSEASTYLLLILGGSALATLFGGLSVRAEESEDVSQAFRRGTRSSLIILAACVWLAQGHSNHSLPSHLSVWALGIFGVTAFTFFTHAFVRNRRTSLLSPAAMLGLSARAPLLVGVGFLVLGAFEPNLSAGSVLFAVIASLAPIATLPAIAAESRRGSTHLAWLVLHPSAVRNAIEDRSLHGLPAAEFWLFGACLLAMDGPALDLERVPGPLAGAMVLLGILAMTLALAMHRRALDDPIRESDRIVSAEPSGGAPTLTRFAELGEKAVTRAGLPLVLFLAISATLVFLGNLALVPAALSAPVVLGLWLGAVTLGVGASGYLSSDPLSTRGSLGPLALTITLTLGALLSSVQSIVL